MRAAPLLLCLLLPACSIAGPSDAVIEAARSPEAEGVVVNRAGADIVPLAIDADLAARIELADEFEVRDRSTVVERGAAAPLAVDGYREGEPFVVYVYRVDGDMARYASALRVEPGEFESDREVVTVRRF